MVPITPTDFKLRQCPACGEMIPAEEDRCARCGLNSMKAVVAQNRLAAEHHFFQSLFTRSNPFTMIFIGANAGVYLLMCLAGGIAITAPDHAVLLGFGAKQNELISRQHEYWRLVTSIFIHVGILHLLINNYALWIIGQEIERIYGSARFVGLYLLTGVLGSIGSYAFNPQATSAGASGAIFGLFGVMATFAFRYRKEIPAALSREIKRRVLPIIALNLVFGLSVQIVDNAAHIGGLLSGVALALIVPYKRPDERVTPPIWRALQVISLAVICASFVGASRSYHGPRLSLSNLTSSPGSSVVTYFEHMQDANRALADSFRIVAGSMRGGNESADLRAAAEAVQRGLLATRSVPPIDPGADQFRQRLVALLNEQKRVLDMLARAEANRQSLANEEQGVQGSFKKFRSEYDEWLPGFLNEHGYEMRGGEK